jgi:hypothetical protein
MWGFRYKGFPAESGPYSGLFGRLRAPGLVFRGARGGEFSRALGLAEVFGSNVVGIFRPFW